MADGDTYNRPLSYALDDTTGGRKAANFGGPQSHQLADLWPEGGSSFVGYRPGKATLSNAQVRAETTKSYLVTASPVAWTITYNQSLSPRSDQCHIDSQSV